jgi:hypothetical protein
MFKKKVRADDGCGCTWPDKLNAACKVHGEIRNCGCGQYHLTMPAMELEDGLKFPAVCREHLQHVPCDGCARAVIRQAEAILYGAPRQGPPTI